MSLDEIGGCRSVCWVVRLLARGCCARVQVERYWIVVTKDSISLALSWLMMVRVVTRVRCVVISSCREAKPTAIVICI